QPAYRSIILSPTGRYAVYQTQYRVLLYDCLTNRRHEVCSLKGKWGFTAGFSPDGERVAVVLMPAREATVYATADRRCLGRCALSSLVGNEWSSCSVSADGQHLALVEGRGTLHVVDLAMGTPLAHHVGHKVPPLALAFSADEKQLYSLTGDEGVYRWDVASGRALARTPLPFYGPVNTVRLYPSAGLGALLP